MCGIVGYVGQKNAKDVIIGGLEHLEYRGYDSAGIAINVDNGATNMCTLLVEKAVGKLNALKEKISHLEVNAESGMGHTRWATHGAPSFNNAHPHRFGKVSLVHNGILENHQQIRQKFKALGHEFSSTTDTEVAAHLLDGLLNEGRTPMEALSALCDTLTGAYSFGIMIEDEPDRVYFAKMGSPLIVAEGENEAFFASDQTALVDHDPNYYSLKDLEIGFISSMGVQVFDLTGKRKAIQWSKLSAKKENVQKLGHKHFMHKEIFEQPEVIERVCLGRLNENEVLLSGFDISFDKIALAEKIQIIACGSSYYAGLLAKRTFESLVKIPTEVEIASEYRYRDTLTNSKTLVIAISQSGETVDTLAALEKAESMGAMFMSVCNVLGSAIAAKCEHSVGNLFLNAGPEISVASTKAFVAQMAALKLFACAMAKRLQLLPKEQERSLLNDFKTLTKSVRAVLANEQEVRTIAEKLLHEPRMLYLGRGDSHPIALEGALKMKELSYIFAEGYPAGELKHGPIATIEPGMPVIVIFSGDALNIKTASNLQEVKARGAKIISIAPTTVSGVKEESDYVIELGPCSTLLEPILATIPLQLLAYHLSDLKGIDVDKPRNLAKSVTVE